MQPKPKGRAAEGAQSAGPLQQLQSGAEMALEPASVLLTISVLATPSILVPKPSTTPLKMERASARETVIAEKFQAMVALGRSKCRMKDFYDIWLLSRSFAFDDDRMPCTIVATFTRRTTLIAN